MQPTIRLRVGAAHRDREVEFRLPPGWNATCYGPRSTRELDEAAIRRAFSRPIGAPPIRTQARRAKTAVILVDDFRRPTPVEPLSLAVIEELTSAGLRKEALSIIIANGAHRPMTQAEVSQRLGAAMDRVAQVISHDAFSADVAYMGLTKAGTPVLVNRLAAEADFSVAISTVYPHAFTAWGGGAKMVLPGICHVSTSSYHHLRIRSGEWGGRPEASPARCDIEEAAALFGLDAVVCALMNPAKQLCGLYIGHPVAAHRRAVRRARQLYQTPIPSKRFDLVIANAYPFDADPTQFSKTEIPARRLGAPVLMIVDLADPCSWHGVYDGPLKAYLRRPQPPIAAPAPDLLWKAEMFLYCPQFGKGFTPRNRHWYCENDWDRLMAALEKRFPRAEVAVLPAAPLQMPIVSNE